MLQSLLEFNIMQNSVFCIERELYSIIIFYIASDVLQCKA